MKSVDAIVRRVTLRELRLLAAIAHSGSILKAAQEVGLSQPALSKALADLEETLGVRLFDRTNVASSQRRTAAYSSAGRSQYLTRCAAGLKNSRSSRIQLVARFAWGARPRCVADFYRMRLQHGARAAGHSLQAA